MVHRGKEADFPRKTRLLASTSVAIMRQALNFRHVEVIHAVVLTGSATGAAERLHVTQPAVSNMLRDAQERVGFELFTRKAGRLVPSASTLALFEEIERSFTGLGEINGLAQRLRRQRGRRIVLACTPVFGAVVLPRMLASLRASSPELMFTAHSRSAEHVAALVSSQKADLGFGLTVPPMPGVQSEVLAELPMVCYLPPGHRLARKRKAVTAADLTNDPMISFSNHEGLDEIVANAFRGCGGPLQRSWNAPQPWRHVPWSRQELALQSLIRCLHACFHGNMSWRDRLSQRQRCSTVLTGSARGCQWPSEMHCLSAPVRRSRNFQLDPPGCCILPI